MKYPDGKRDQRTLPFWQLIITNKKHSISILPQVQIIDSSPEMPSPVNYSNFLKRGLDTINNQSDEKQLTHKTMHKIWHTLPSTSA